MLVVDDYVAGLILALVWGGEYPWMANWIKNSNRWGAVGYNNNCNNGEGCTTINNGYNGRDNDREGTHFFVCHFLSCQANCWVTHWINYRVSLWVGCFLSTEQFPSLQLAIKQGRTRAAGGDEVRKEQQQWLRATTTIMASNINVKSKKPQAISTAPSNINSGEQQKIPWESTGICGKQHWLRWRPATTASNNNYDNQKQPQ